MQLAQFNSQFNGSNSGLDYTGFDDPTIGVPGPKGDKGDKGDPGAPAGFGHVSASITNTTGTPKVTVYTSGPDTAKDFEFVFENTKGEPGADGKDGAPGERGPQGLTGEKGADGKDGAPGEPGPEGPRGVPGETGPKGDKGDPFTYDDFTPEQLAALTGPAGKDGEQGPPGPKGDEGVPGEQGQKGDNGEPGFSPTIKVEDVDGGHKVIITDKDGPKEFTVLNGVAGEIGETGDPGKDALIDGHNVLKTDETLMVTEDGTMGVSIPVKGVTKAEFDHMSEQEKKGYLIVVDEDSPIPGIGEIAATIDQTIGEATVDVIQEPGKTTFSFSGIKGETGAQGPQGPKGDTTQTEEIYSTAETKIGTWIDGRPIYRRVFQFTTPTAGNEMVIPASSSISMLVNLYGFIANDSGNFSPLNYVYWGVSGNTNTLVEAVTTWYGLNGIRVKLTSSPNTLASKPGIVILEYTKTSDPATINLETSIDILMPETTTQASKSKEVM